MTTTTTTTETSADPKTRQPRSEASKQWARLDELDRYLLQAACTMEKIRDPAGVASTGRLTRRPRAYEDLVAAGTVLLLLIPDDGKTVRDDDQKDDTHRVVPTAIGKRLVRAAHEGRWVNTTGWIS